MTTVLQRSRSAIFSIGLWDTAHVTSVVPSARHEFIFIMAVGCMVILDFLQLYLTQSLWTIHFVCLTQKCDYYSHRSYTVKDK